MPTCMCPRVYVTEKVKAVDKKLSQTAMIAMARRGLPGPSQIEPPVPHPPRLLAPKLQPVQATLTNALRCLTVGVGS
eukprot:1157388-Pelagomonas_calceolata.AAC.14